MSGYEDLKEKTNASKHQNKKVVPKDEQIEAQI